MKRKFARLVVIVLVLCGSIVLLAQYSIYRRYVELLSSPGLFQVTDVLQDYKLENGQYPDKMEFYAYIEVHDKYLDLLDYFDFIDYDIINRNDSTILYTYGFDNKDDTYQFHYDLSKVDFVNSYWIKGDIPIAIIENGVAQNVPVNPFKKNGVSPPKPDQTQ